ncbi:MAG: hypothetical protein ABF289_09485 [Clostridiales bacterium]
MTSDQAYTTLIKITSLYNKVLTDEQIAVWMDELKPLDEISTQKVVRNLKSNNLYSCYMPTLPQFLSLYKANNGNNCNDEIIQDYCFVCCNKGFEIIREYTTVDNITRFYEYMLHCDCCEKGKQEEISYKNVYSEPISKYFNVNDLARINRKKKEESLKRKRLNQPDEARKKFYKLLSGIY